MTNFLKSSQPVLADLWCEVRGEYFPPQHEIVWTYDGIAVRPGIWVWDWEPSKPLKDSIWKDPDGNILQVTHWASFEESPYAPPAPPQAASTLPLG